MLEPNDSETNLDNTEDACKSDYFSDEGEVKSDTVNSENVSTGKRKPTDIGPDEAKKIKVHVTSADSATDKATKLPTGSTSSNDFKRASSVNSDNSDEFVDAVDVLEPSQVIDKKPATSTDDVDTCAVKNPASDNVRKSIFESEGPKVKENKFISRLPTFADDPLDRFNSSAIRRGFFKETETETVKADYNFDVHPSDKNETKNENKVVKKVKLNRSKFFNTDKPKFSDESSSDSNPKFNNATSPVKPETILSSENKTSQSIKNENKSTTLPVDEKTSATKQPLAAVSSSVEIPRTETKLNSTTEPGTVSVENDNSPVRVEIVSTEPSSTSSAKKNTQGAPQDQRDPQVESISLDVPRESKAVPEPREVINSKIDVEEANKLIEEVEMMEQSSIELVLETTDIDEKIIDSPVVHKEPISVQRMEPEPESIMLESESQSIEPESQSAISKPQIIEPEPQSIEPEPSNIECSLQLTGPEPQLITPEVPQVESKPDQSVASSSVSAELPSIPIKPQPETPAIESPIPKQIENEIIEQSTYQAKKLNDDLPPLNGVSTQPTLVEPEVPESESKSSVPESATLQESLPESNFVLEVSAPDSAPLNELIDEKESTLPDSEPITVMKLISEEIIPEPENLPKPETQSQTEPALESEVQNVDLDITTESEDIADDKSEPDVSNEESEGELEEEEEEIHEEELYLEDRMPPISKPRDPTPPPEPVPSPEPVASSPTQKRVEEVVEMDVDDQEIALQLSDQSAPDSPVAEESIQPIASSKSVENIPVEQTVQSTPSLENTENISVEKSKQPTPSLENLENISVEKSEQPAPSLENIENTFVEKSKQPTPSLENLENISVEKSKQPTPSAQNTENISAEKPKQPTQSVVNITEISVEKLKEPTILLENIDISAEKPKQPTPPLETTENIPVEKPKQPTPSSENIEDIPAEKPKQPATLLKNAEDTSIENSIQPTSSSENIKNFSVKKSKEPTSSVKNDESVPVERPIKPFPPVTIKITPIKRPAQPTRSESTKNISAIRSDHRKQSLKDIENIPMDIDDEPELITTPEQSTASKQTTTPERTYKELSKLEQALTSKPGVKRLEVQVPLEEIPPQFDPGSGRDSSADGDETKGKIKLHLSLQGDKVSIKKGPSTAVSSTGEVKVKRQYRKRNKDGNLKPDKTYKLRNRSAKADDGAAPENGQNDKPVASASTEKCVDLTVNLERKLDKIYSAEPILIDSDDSTKSAPTKVQPIKLKITKNSNVTIECTSSSSEVDKNREVSNDIRKKESIPNMMEQAATAWSGPDLQRVERLLKESNITITPVIPKEAPPTPHTISRPIPSALKERPSVAPKFSTPSVTSTVSSLQTAISSITPIPRDKFEDSPSKHTTPQRPDHQNGEAVNHLRFRECFETPASYADKQIDIKSEIRKMLASADKRKIEPRDSTDAESDSSDSKPKLKAVPDLVPINLPTPEMLQSLASSLTTSSTSEGESSTDKSKAELDSTILPLLQTFPKKRGRPTKAMVAAREALKQSQEAALENLKQLATQKASEGQPIPVPILDITDPEDLFKPKRGRKSRSEKMEKSSDAEQSASEATTDPEREAESNKRLEEERIKKEEEKERRNEIRRQKARERNDLVKAKRLRQKMKAEERQKRMQEKRRMLQEEKKKLEEEIKNLPKSLPSFDDETRMSAENSQSQNVSFSTGMGDEDSSNATTELSQRVKKSRMEVTDIDSRDLTVDQIAEYQWPIQGGDLYMIQEQVSNYLGVKSFKRKYPDIKRRPVDSEEKAYLVDSGLVSETLCDLGLTAVSSAEVLDIMCADFPDKYEELRKYMREKQMKELSFKQKAWASGLGYKFLMADGTKQDLKKRAMESASNWNSALNKSRSDDRRCAIDLQTFIIHYPKTRTRKMTIPTPKMGSYPVSILPGQFCDFYKTYTSTELRYMPINTVMYGPLKPHATAPGDGSQTDSDDSSSSDESSTSSEGTQGTEDTVEDIDKDMSVDESSQLDKSHDLNLLKEQMTMELSENTRELIMDETAKILCKICLGNITRNKENVPEVLIYCSQCSSTSHPSCLDLSLDMVPHIKKYSWQCPDCKICARCKENADEDKMLFCDICDRGYHIYCVGLKKVPSGRWQCQECTVVENNLCLNNSTPVRDVFKEPGLIEAHDG